MKRNKILITANVDRHSAEFLKKYSERRELSFSSVIDTLVRNETFRLEMEIKTLKKIMED